MSKYKIGEAIPPWVHPNTLRWMAEQIEAYRDSLRIDSLCRQAPQAHDNAVICKFTGGLVTRLNTIANDVEAQLRGVSE